MVAPLARAARVRLRSLTAVRFHGELWLPAALDDVFRFFSDASNLERLTPPWLKFRLESAGPIVMRPGAVIDYRLRIHGVPVRWRSEITVWDPPHRFVDEQRRGPYRRWVHTHAFRAERGGTVVEDDVEYDVPFAPIAARFVRRDVEKIFGFRSSALRRIFPPL